MKKSLYICPVCGFKGLKEMPYDKKGIPSYEICHCCGFEFGTDEKEGMAQFREKWIKKGAPWFTQKLKPADWDLQKQLKMK